MWCVARASVYLCCSAAVPSCARFCVVLMSCPLKMCRCFAPRRLCKKYTAPRCRRTSPKHCNFLNCKTYFSGSVKNAIPDGTDNALAWDAKHCNIYTSVQKNYNDTSKRKKGTSDVLGSAQIPGRKKVTYRLGCVTFSKVHFHYKST